jgi:hypothetical protein
MRLKQLRNPDTLRRVVKDLNDCRQKTAKINSERLLKLWQNDEYRTQRAAATSKIKSKPVRAISTSTNEQFIFSSVSKASEWLGITKRSYICQACKGKIQTYRGYRWEYV